MHFIVSFSIHPFIRRRGKETIRKSFIGTRNNVKCHWRKNGSAKRLASAGKPKSKEKASVSRLVGRSPKNGPEVTQTRPGGYFPVPSTVTELWLVCVCTRTGIIFCQLQALGQDAAVAGV
ncbi:hypothetical protein CEXT_425281 [Caerostris extrusa]|uniref:Uncharacterized protein n=1 Tax=Caerostris extrusa TaxID=172846 RepID=A0AAV4UY38_CAEEX|nr:hypothetical protein CEXT_425281 [Caerostris extrusa]